jgi:CRP/FNR family transcriptional regulator, cyclic AMP receptor protein
MASQPRAWLPGLSPDLTPIISARARRRVFQQGETVFHKGDPGVSMFLILDGQVKIVLPSDEGEEALVGVLDAGECFGELSMIDGAPRSATVVAAVATETLMIQREDFLQAVATHPRLALDLLRILAGRLRATDEVVADVAFLDVPARLAKRLLELARDYGTTGPDGTTIGLRLTQSELAAMVGATRESVNKHLGAFRSRGVLDMQRVRILIHRPEELRRRIY